MGESLSEDQLMKINQTLQHHNSLRQQEISQNMKSYIQESMLRAQDPYLQEENRYLNRLKES